MPKLTLNDINNISGNPTSAEQLLNANFTAIEEAVEKTLSRDGTLPNALEAALDANSQRIINLPYALTNTEPVTLAQVMAIVSGGDWTGGLGTPAIVFYQEVAPTATAAGQVWIKLSDTSIWVWDGVSWVRQRDPDIETALTLAQGNKLEIDDIKPRMLTVEQDSAVYAQAIIDLENETTSLAGSIVTITADLGVNSAAISSESIARANADLALATTINQIQASNGQIFAQAGMPVPGVGGVPNPIPEGSWWYDTDDGNAQYRYVSGAWVLVDSAEIAALQAAITTEQTARIDGDSALAVDITNLWAQRNSDYAYTVTVNQARIDGDVALAQQYNSLNATVGTVSASVTTETNARVAGDNAIASSVSSLTSTVNGQSTTISQHTSSINGIEGKYGIKIDSNGYITGFGLIATNNNSAPTSTFTVLAENFRIVTPGSSPVSPFYTVGGITYIRDVRIGNAVIDTAAIGTVNIAQNAVSDVVTQAYDFFGASGPSVGVGTFANLSTVYGTASITMPSIALPGSKVLIRGYFNARRAGSEGEDVIMRIRRNDGVILPSTPTMRLGASILVYSWEYVDANPVSTSHTYTYQVSRASGGTGIVGDWYDIQLIGTVLKR